MTTTARPDKAELRRQALARRATADLSTGAALRDAVLALPELSTATCVTAYVARMAEPDTAPLIDELHRRGTRVLLPVLLPDLDLDWAPDDGERHRSSVHRGLTEPTGTPLGRDAIAEADVVLAPALAVDRSGVRLGYGGGCYDRALTRIRPGTLVVALLHEGELRDEPLPAEDHDRRVDAVALPSGVVRIAP
ncbi:MAG: 5-formyltetrahydrofolate cyclo-ligase [Actinomycetales bacterium]